MGNLWLKIKVGTKIAIFVILLIATLLFVFNNSNQRVKIWLWNEYDTTLLKVLFFTVLTSVIFTILIGTAFRTIRQIKEIRARSRSQKLEDEIRDMKSKASMLQTRPPDSAGNAGTSAASFTVSSDATPSVDPSKPAEP
jgi:hypothetical protein